MRGMSQTSLAGVTAARNNSLAYHWAAALRNGIAYLYSFKILLGLLSVAAIALVYIHSAVQHLIPWFQLHIKTATITLDAVVDTFRLLKDAVMVIQRIVKKLTCIFSKCETLPPLVLMDFKLYSANEVTAMLTEFVTASAKYNTGPKASQFLLQCTLGRAICPYVRAFYHTPVGPISTTALSWMVLHPDPDFGHACNSGLEMESVHIVAAAANAGLIWLEVVLPAIVVLVMMKSIGLVAYETVVVIHYRIASLGKKFPLR